MTVSSDPGPTLPGSWVRTAAGAHLANRRSRDTSPELRLRSQVHRLGLRFRVHVRVLPGCTPDFVLPRWRLAVFVDGCFWHGCPEHGMKQFRGPNADRWREKLATNRDRDRRNDRNLADAGWRVLRIWECDIRRDVSEAARRVRHEAAGQPACDSTSSKGNVSETRRAR